MSIRAINIWRELRFGFRAGWREGVGSSKSEILSCAGFIIGAILMIQFLAQ